MELLVLDNNTLTIVKRMQINVIYLVLDRNNWNHLNVRKQMIYIR